MRRGDEAGASKNNEFWEVSHLAARLTQYACEVGARHLADDFIRVQFTQEVAQVGQSVVEDLQAGKISAAQARESLEEEYQKLALEVWEYLKLAAGVTAGVMQISTGLAVCKMSFGVGCVLGGLPLILHGANNVYENSMNIVKRGAKTVGPVRKAYQDIAMVAGGSAAHGNIAYGTLDLGLSAYNLSRLVLKPGAWRLFRYLEADKVKAYQQMGKRSIIFEVGMDMLTGDQILVELKED